MYELTSVPGKNGACSYCCLSYSDNRKYGGFVPFVDPIYQSGANTIYGCDCCQHCYKTLINMNQSERFQFLFSGSAFRGRRFDGFTVLSAALEQGRYPPELPATPLLKRPDLGSAVTIGSIECVHVSLIRWSETKGVPVYRSDRWREVKYRW